MADTPTPNTWRRLQDTRRQQGHTLTALAAKAGLSLPFVSQLESGQRRGRADTHKALADALGVDALWLTEDLPA